MTEATIFAAALERTTPTDRAAFLAEACAGDDRLRRRVEALLKAHAEPDEILDIPPRSSATADYAPITEKPGSMIGRYKLKEQIGEGGFGLVFVAEQQEPVQRKVALKVIRPGMDTREVMARFTAERQALALMDHPNIARVLDAGATDSGRPYFVMELVRGIPITDYCDQNQLAPRDRLDLFVTVCQAVQHAHQKGIIHRDIKPSNVLVTSHDGKPVAKVIDFGVAKAINQQLTDRSIYTQFAQMIGTPLYMSPEQAEMSGLDIDTRSDIYSLGVLLYELLTGTTPFDKKRFARAAFDEIRRLIREEEPPKPSTRLSTSDSLASIAAQRHTEPAKLSKLIRGDLDWITMKALEKDRTRRYETANGLARDIERYLNDEPVEACPPSATYRLRKFARKNRAALTTATAIALLLVAGVAVSTWQAVRATQAEGLAAERLKTETATRQEADEARRRARANELRAVTEAQRATVVADLLQQMLASANPDVTKGAGLTVRELLEAFAAGLDEQLKDQPEVEATIRGTIGRAYWRLGLFDEAERHLARALELRRAGAEPKLLAQSLVDWGWVMYEQHKYAAGEMALHEALKLYREPAGDPRKVLAAFHVLQMIEWGQQRWDEVERIALDARQVAAAVPGHEDRRWRVYCTSWRVSGATRGRPVEAEQLARESVDMLRRTGPKDHPELAFALLALGRALASQGKYADAEGEFRNALTIFRKHYPDDQYHGPQFAVNELSAALRAQGKPAEAEAVANESARRLLTLLGEAPRDFQGWLNLADALRQAQLWGMALHGYQEAIKLGENVDSYNRLRLAHGFLSVGRGLQDQAKYADSAAALRHAAPLFERVIAEAPSADDTAGETSELAGVWAYLSVSLEELDRVAEAVDARRTAVGIWSQLGETQPEQEWYAHEGAYFSTSLAELLDTVGRPKDALEYARTGVRLHKKLAVNYPDKKEYSERLYGSCQTLLQVLLSLSQNEEADALSRELVDRSRQTYGAESPQFAAAMAMRGLVCLRQRKWDDAERALRECMTIRAESVPDAWTTFNTKSMLGGALLGQKKYADAEPLLLAGYEGMKQRETTIPPQSQVRIPEAIERLVQLYEATDKKADAAKWSKELDASKASKKKAAKQP